MPIFHLVLSFLNGAIEQITDDLIKELYLFCVEAYDKGEKQIPVYIFPMKMTSSNFTYLTKNYFSDKAKIAFWKNILVGYDKFEKNHEALKTSISEKGEYLFQ